MWADSRRVKCRTTFITFCSIDCFIVFQSRKIFITILFSSFPSNLLLASMVLSLSRISRVFFSSCRRRLYNNEKGFTAVVDEVRLTATSLAAQQKRFSFDLGALLDCGAKRLIFQSRAVCCCHQQTTLRVVRRLDPTGQDQESLSPFARAAAAAVESKKRKKEKQQRFD